MTKSSRDRAETKAHVFVVIENFLAKEAYSGLLLFGAAVVAMVWANSPWSESYFDLWDTSFGLSFGDHGKEMHLSHWVNDGLMAVFFLLIGLEIKRELLIGELSSLRRAAFPVAAALGGMLLPVVFYLLVNLQSDGVLEGFGVPMATDIAFALGFLLLLGDRVPLSLKIFLTSLAVFDDLGAIGVIAVFYSESIQWEPLGYALLVLAALLLLNRTGVKRLGPYLMLGIVLWFLFEASGVHATIAGVLLALTIPLHARIDSERFLDIARCELDTFNGCGYSAQGMILTPEQQDSLETIEDAYEAVQNPLVRLEHRLHPFSAFFVMPLFALANAGVELGGIEFSMFNPVGLGILLGLILGKPLGIAGVAYLATRLGWAQKPEGLTWRHVRGVALLGGVGFTMSIFVTQLAFDDMEMIALGKLLIVACSVLMGVMGTVSLLRVADRKRPQVKTPL